MDFNHVALSTATIQTNKLLENIQNFKQLLKKDTNFMAVIKANAYSHGAVPLAHKMEAAHAADYFGVAQLSEALALRADGIQTPILVFNSVRVEEIKQAIKQQITLTVFSDTVAKEIVAAAEDLSLQAKVHLKIDSGMARLGVTTFAEAKSIYDTLQSGQVHLEGIYTHFADAYDDAPDNFTHEQFLRFKTILDQFEEQDLTFDLRHSCNTSATILFPDYHLDMVRVGLGLYGLDPTSVEQEKVKLTPIETVRTTVTHIKEFPAGESVGYERNFFSKEPMKIATVAIGYADGVAKSLSNKGFFTYLGHKLPIIGDVCMDQIMLDCSNISDLEVGVEVTYFGNPVDSDLLVTEVAKIAEASQYDLLCRIGDRVKRIYQ